MRVCCETIMRIRGALPIHPLLAVLLAGMAVSPATLAEAAPLAPRVVNGVHSQSDAAAGALLRVSESRLDSSCSGTLIGCRTFLTAAHCVCPGDRFCSVEPSSYRVFLQHAGIFAVEKVVVHPAYSFGIQSDIAVVTLAGPVEGIQPASINTVGLPPTGTSGQIVGFGVSHASADDSGIKRRGTVKTSSCAGSPLLIPEPAHLCWSFASPLGTPGDNSNTCAGDSGGPLFVDLGAGPVLAGVASGGTNSNCLPLDVSFDTNVFLNLSFISSAIGADSPGVNCGSLAPVGSASTQVMAAGSATLTKPTRLCRKEIAKHVAKFVRTGFKAWRDCLDRVAAGRSSGPCPDEKALAVIDKARANVDATKIARKCPGAIPSASVLGAGCAAARDAVQVRDCTTAAGDVAIAALIAAAYADPSLAAPLATAHANCQKAIGNGFAKYVATRLRASSVCRSNADKGKVEFCPDDRALAKIARARAKFEAALDARCDAATLAALAPGGEFGSGCIVAGDASALANCLLARADAEADATGAIVVEVQAGANVRFDVPPGTLAVRLTANAEDPFLGSRNNVDLYLRHSVPASVATHDYASVDGGVFEAIEIIAPEPGLWFAHIDEVAGRRVPFQLTITTFEP